MTVNFKGQSAYVTLTSRDFESAGIREQKIDWLMLLLLPDACALFFQPGLKARDQLGLSGSVELMCHG